MTLSLLKRWLRRFDRKCKPDAYRRHRIAPVVESLEDRRVLSAAAMRASDFTDSIGVNAHLDFVWTAYRDLQIVENSLKYLGVKNVRDSANDSADVGGRWQQVASATGALFDAYIGEGSPASMKTGLQLIEQIAPKHILSSIEGGNEEDDAYPASQGNSLAITARFQQEVYALGQSLGLPVINMSFGAGWTDSPNGNYGAVGDISAYSDYANAHIYSSNGDPPSAAIAFVNGLAQLSSKHSVIATEMGWHTTGNRQDASSVSEGVQAKYLLDGLLDASKAGNVKTYLYELLDQNTGDGISENNFGLFHSDGTPKPAATAVHNLVAILDDSGSSSRSFAPTSLSYRLLGAQPADNSLLMEKSNGAYVLSIWNESRLSGPASATDIDVPDHTITLTLSDKVSRIRVFDPMTGTAAKQSLSNARTVRISLPDHPVLVEITPFLRSVPTIEMPASLSVPANGTTPVAASIRDAWAASNPGFMALNVSVSGGTLAMTDASGRLVAGSGTAVLHLSGTLSELNAYLASLKYHALGLAGTQTLTLDVWNQAGIEVEKSAVLLITTIGDSRDLSLSLPAFLCVPANATVPVAASISDPWAGSNPGLLAVNVSVSGGTLAMADANGRPVAGSGTATIHLDGTLSELNDYLASLKYRALGLAGAQTLTLDVWNQAGVEVTASIAIQITRRIGRPFKTFGKH